MYFLITPARNEATYFPTLVEHVLTQETQPERWLIVDDGSTDGTSELVKTYAETIPWITGVHLNRNDANYDTEFGYATVVATGLEIARERCRSDWELCQYAGILDCDILVQPDYFETLLETMRSREKCGLASGLLHSDGKRDTTEGNPWGGAMVIDKQCLADFGGYPITPAPDSVVRIKAEKRGWETLKTTEVEGYQLRPPQSARGVWNGYKRKGTGRYYLNYHPVNALLTGVYHMLSRPHYSGLAYLYGYLVPYWKGENRIDDREVTEHYRTERFEGLKRSLQRRTSFTWHRAMNSIRRELL